jgi:hypothetical protein
VNADEIRATYFDYCTAVVVDDGDGFHKCWWEGPINCGYKVRCGTNTNWNDPQGPRIPVWIDCQVNRDQWTAKACEVVALPPWGPVA